MTKKSNLDRYKSKRSSEKKGVKSKNFSKKNQTVSKNEKIDETQNAETFLSKYSKFLPWAIMLFTFIVFSTAIGNDFLNWDDDRYVTGNKHLLLNWTNIKYFFTEFYFVMYIPLAMFSYMLDFKLVGLEHPWVFHLHNVVLHVLNTGLVFIFIKKLFSPKGNKKYYYAFFVALLFGVHSLHIESVSWIAERKDVLYSFYLLIAMNLYIQYTENQKFKYIAFTFIFYILSLFSKTQAVVMPLLMIAVDYYRRNFLTDKSQLVDFITFKDKKQWKIFAEKLPFFAFSLIFGLLAIKASGTTEPFAQNLDAHTKTAVDTGYGVIEKIMLISYSLMMYFTELVFPFKQSPVHPYPFGIGEMPMYFYVFSLFTLAFIAFFVWAWIKKQKEILLGLMFFIFNLIIVLHIKNFIISEHYLYLPAIGISILLITLVLKLAKKAPHAKKMLLIVSILYIGFLSIKTYERNKIFENSLTFWNDVTKKYPQVLVAYFNSGNYLQSMGDETMPTNQQKALAFYQKAVEEYTKTIERHNRHTGAYTNRGITLAKMGNYKKAIENFNQVVSLDSSSSDIFSNRGNAWGLLGNWQNAVKDYNKALQLNPNLPNARFSRGVAYANLDSNRLSITDLTIVLKSNPNQIEAYSNRGISYYKLNLLDSAIADFNIFLNAYPSRYNILYYRGMAHYKKNEKSLAEKDFELLRTQYPQIFANVLQTATSIENRADATGQLRFYQEALDLINSILIIDKNYALAYARIGVIYGKLGNMNLAFSNFNKALELDPNNYEAYSNRGYAYFITKKNSLALKDLNKAIELNPAGATSYFNRGILYYNSGNYNKSVSDFSKVLEINPQYIVAYEKRGLAYLKLNNRQAACQDWTNALNNGLKSADYYLSTYCNEK